MMEFRNPKFNEHGSIDLEINHSDFGWIPFTAVKDSPDISGEIYDQAFDVAEPFVPVVVEESVLLADVKLALLAFIRDVHAVTLSHFVQEYSEVDTRTFSNKQKWAELYNETGDAEARARLEGMLTTAQVNAIIASGGAPAQIMADRINQKVAELETVTVICEKARNELREVVEAATVLGQLPSNQEVIDAMDAARLASETAIEQL